jgi:hypothetical protein
MQAHNFIDRNIDKGTFIDNNRWPTIINGQLLLRNDRKSQSAVNTPASYSVGPGLKSLTADRLS